MRVLRLKYRLTKEEIEEALLCLEYKREGLYKKINLWVVTILGIVVLAAYMREPEIFPLFVVLGVIILLLFYIGYGTRRRRSKNAQKIADKKGDYQLFFTDSYVQFGDKNDKLMFRKEKMVLYFSDNMLTFKIGQEVFTIPKRILNSKQQEKLVKIAKDYEALIVNISIEKE